MHYCGPIIQPGCQTGQPPTQYMQDRATLSTGSEAGSSSVKSPIVATPSGDGSLDAAFNAGFEDDAFAPRDDFSEFDSIESIAPIEEAPQVTVDGSSFKTYRVKKGDSLWGVSRRYDVSLNDLYKANGLNKNSVHRVGQQIQIPDEGAVASVQTVVTDAYQPSGYNQPSISYIVSRGDNFTKIAKRFDTTVKSIKAANSKISDTIRVGEVLVIPVGDDFKTSYASSTVVTPVTGTTAAVASSTRVHVVKAGEYPAAIAKKYGMTTNELLAINGITDPRRMQIGQKLKVSPTGSANNVDSQQTVVPASALISTSSVSTVQAAEPVEITVIEADPLIESEFQSVELVVADEPVQAVEVVEEDVDLFDNAVEIPVIRLEE